MLLKSQYANLNTQFYLSKTHIANIQMIYSLHMSEPILFHGLEMGRIDSP